VSGAFTTILENPGEIFIRTRKRVSQEATILERLEGNV